MQWRSIRSSSTAFTNRIKLKINQITEETDKLTEAIQDKESNSLDETFISEKLESIHQEVKELTKKFPIYKK